RGKPSARPLRGRAACPGRSRPHSHSARLAVTNPSSTLDVRSASGRRNVNKQGGPVMNAASGHVRENGGPMTGPPAALEIATAPRHPAERVKELVAALEVPFDPSQI